MRARRGHLTIGVDVGGTFTDVVVASPLGLEVLKLPTTADPAAAVLSALKGLGPRAKEAGLISHATTLATNALLTHEGLARAALITNEGFRDILEIGRQKRPELYDFATRRPKPLVRRRDRLTVRCRIDASGSELEPLRGASALARLAARRGYESVAICFLNSYLNGKHEREMRGALRRAGFRGQVSISSEVDNEHREYERTSTTVVNAALSPLIAGYLSSVLASLRRVKIGAPLYVMNSDGGASTAAFASSRPVSIIESGPAAGVVASRELARALSHANVLTFDMGGTTAKAATIVGFEPELIDEFEAAGKSHSGRSIRGSGYPVRGEFIDLAEVSGGGGTIAWADEAGELKVGPESAGSDPGPACYGAGGVHPTVTDANVVLGRLNPVTLLGGAMPIRRDLALASVRRLAKGIHTSPLASAKGVVRLVNHNMARAMALVTVERGRDPREFVMFAFGGAGPVHACDLAEEMGISEVIVPLHAGLFSAYGLVASVLTRTFMSPVMEAAPRLERRFRELESEAAVSMKEEGFSRFELTRHFEARYQGQSHELILPFSSDSGIRKAFDARHKALYGYSLPEDVEVVNIKVKATVPRRAPRLWHSQSGPFQPPKERQSWIGGVACRAPVFQRSGLPPGRGGKGPCIIEDYDHTIVVNQSWRWRAEGYGVRLTR